MTNDFPPLSDGTPTPGQRDALDRIAARHLGLCDLAQKGNDRDDFREVAVWLIKAALEAAYVAGRGAPRDAVADRAPDCTTASAATIAGVIAEAVMAGEMSLGQGSMPAAVRARLFGPDGDLPLGTDRGEGLRVAGLMISARARASVRTPDGAALSAAEAALALAEDALDRGTHPVDGEEAPDAVAVLASLADTLRAGLARRHAAERIAGA